MFVVDCTGKPGKWLHANVECNTNSTNTCTDDFCCRGIPFAVVYSGDSCAELENGIPVTPGDCANAAASLSLPWDSGTNAAQGSSYQKCIWRYEDQVARYNHKPG